MDYTLDANSVDTMILLLTNVMNQEIIYMQILKEIGLIDLSIAIGQKLEQDKRLAERLLWLYSCLLHNDMPLSWSQQKQILLWAQKLHQQTKSRASTLEFGRATFNFIQREGLRNERHEFVYSLEVDLEFWDILLQGKIGCSSFLVSAKLMCEFLRHDGYKPSCLSVTNMDILLKQLTERTVFGDLVDPALPVERSCLMEIIQEWLSSSHAQDAHFHLVVHRLADFVMIVECTQDNTELQTTFGLISQMIRRYHKDKELQSQLARNSVLCRAVLASFDETNFQLPRATLIAGLTCLEDLLILGELMGRQLNGTIDMEYDAKIQMRDQRDNPFKEECLRAAELDYLQHLLSSKVRDVATLAQNIVNEYLELLLV